MEIHDIENIIEGILFASGEPVSISRIAAVLGTDEDSITQAAAGLRDRYIFERRGMRLVFLDRAVQLCSAPEYADYIRLALETRKQPQLSQQALEVLSIVAYFQPVTKLYIEQVRGVDSSYTVGLLQERKLIETCGRLSVPGRPLLYKTTPAFLRTFGLTSLEELPELPEPDQPDKDGDVIVNIQTVDFEQLKDAVEV
ncbi:MAG: SMC-Scp complex subunit ScpB [Clostridiales bacterium]|nr:SMC-Scp complex subunit ScpB [Clostridiales bacterium]